MIHIDKQTFLEAQLNIAKLTPLQFDGIMRAMEEYGKHLEDKEKFEHMIKQLNSGESVGLSYLRQFRFSRDESKWDDTIQKAFELIKPPYSINFEIPDPYTEMAFEMIERFVNNHWWRTSRHTKKRTCGGFKSVETLKNLRSSLQSLLGYQREEMTGRSIVYVLITIILTRAEFPDPREQNMSLMIIQEQSVYLLDMIIELQSNKK